MLGAQSTTVRTITDVAYQTNLRRWITSSHSYSPIHSSSLKLHLQCTKSCKKLKSKFVTVSCRMNDHGCFDNDSNNREASDDDGDYVEATVLLSETIRHYQMLMHGFQEETQLQSSAQLVRFSLQAKDPRLNNNYLGEGFLRRFQSPAIFLKVSCTGDFVLPIFVGGHAVGRIIESLHEDETEDCPNQFQVVKDLLERLGYEVKMVRITERVVNTYFARIYFSKPGEKDTLSMDARPSDAINIAIRCMAPIFVNKYIIFTDAIRIVYGMNRTGNAKCGYDVSLDSAAEGPDLISEELYLVRNMSLAAQEERYSDAAMWRDKLIMLRQNNKSSLV